MRYIKINGPGEEHDVIDAAGNIIGRALLTLEQMLNGNCWNQPEWRQDEAWLSAFDRLTDAFDTGFKAKAEFVGVDDNDYEKFAPIATLKGKPIAPHMARAVNRVSAPITRASSKEPEVAKQLNGAEKALPEVAQA